MPSGKTCYFLVSCSSHQTRDMVQTLLLVIVVPPSFLTAVLFDRYCKRLSSIIRAESLYHFSSQRPKIMNMCDEEVIRVIVHPARQSDALSNGRRLERKDSTPQTSSHPALDEVATSLPQKAWYVVLLQSQIGHIVHSTSLFPILRNQCTVDEQANLLTSLRLERY